MPLSETPTESFVITSHDELESRLKQTLDDADQNEWMPYLLHLAGKPRSSMEILSYIRLAFRGYSSKADRTIINTTAIQGFESIETNVVHYKPSKTMFASFFPNIERGKDEWEKLPEEDRGEDDWLLQISI